MSGKPTPGKQPPFVQHQVEAKRIKDERGEHEANRTAINAIANKIDAYQAQQKAGEKGKTFREKLTIWLLIATTSFSLIAVIVSAWSGYAQHTDSAAAVVTAKDSSDAALKEAQSATAEARRQATAAETQVAASAENEQRQLRAYVGAPMTGLGIDCERCNPAKLQIGAADNATFSIKNYGLTPAYRPTVCPVVHYRKQGELPDLGEIMNSLAKCPTRDNSPNVHATMWPGDTIPQGVLITEPTQTRDVFNNWSYFIFILKIDYTDIFGIDRTTYRCISLHVLKIKKAYKPSFAGCRVPGLPDDS